MYLNTKKNYEVTVLFLDLQCNHHHKNPLLFLVQSINFSGFKNTTLLNKIACHR